jgi:hypothetical protein
MKKPFLMSAQIKKKEAWAGMNLSRFGGEILTFSTPAYIILLSSP